MKSSTTLLRRRFFHINQARVHHKRSLPILSAKLDERPRVPPPQLTALRIRAPPTQVFNISKAA
jgi:hypothetical protein